ncbi:MAG TPA: UbiX family flavin prenyltransferase [Candidatus Thermoplasmatota archaeon]|nr:UbiX family flavin prenyltransferase [Candidatus Thermoplasmatota archaeon]
MPREIVVAMSGASGAPYGIKVLETLAKTDFRVHLVTTPTAERILRYETGRDPADLRRLAHAVHAIDDFFAPIASGSHDFAGMIVAPCSMKTVGLIANGIADDLIARTGDVCLKERRPLALVVRETPLSTIHLRNMTTLSEAGATIVPAMPAFYTKPKSIDDMVAYVAGKALDALRVPHDLYPRWKPMPE